MEYLIEKLSQTPEDVRDNIVKIVDNENKFIGTGFFAEVKGTSYCITCHHCICRLDEIYVELAGKKRFAEWIEKFSDSSKDIAIMKVRDCNSVKPLKYGKAMAQLTVSLWGYSALKLNTFPRGTPANKGSLSNATFLFHWGAENVGGDKKWNTKPEVNVYVFQFDGKFDVGYSGSPVCYSCNTINLSR